MNPLLDEHQLAAHFGRKVSTIRAWRLKGTGPQWIDIGGGTVRYRVEDIEAYQEASRTGGVVPARAACVIDKAAMFFDIINGWKIGPDTRKYVMEIRDELRALLD